jgi:hypothetical protein
LLGLKIYKPHMIPKLICSRAVEVVEVLAHLHRDLQIDVMLGVLAQAAAAAVEDLDRVNLLVLTQRREGAKSQETFNAKAQRRKGKKKRIVSLRLGVFA